jgi:hypothetical protein
MTEPGAVSVPRPRAWLWPLLAAGVIAAYFFRFAAPGLAIGLTHDDLMNLYKSWEQPLTAHLRDIVLFFRVSPSFRPAGSVFYRLWFEWWGFDPLPYRIACYALLFANLVLGYAVARRIGGSREVGLLAALLYAYHGEFWPIYTNTGFVYDLLCFFFYGAALLYYLRVRENAGARQVAV